MSVFCLSKGRVFPSLSEEYIEYGQSDDLMCLLVTSSLVPFWWDGRYGDLHDRSVLNGRNTCNRLPTYEIYF